MPHIRLQLYAHAAAKVHLDYTLPSLENMAFACDAYMNQRGHARDCPRRCAHMPTALFMATFACRGIVTPVNRAVTSVAIAAQNATISFATEANNEWGDGIDYTGYRAEQGKGQIVDVPTASLPALKVRLPPSDHMPSAVAVFSDACTQSV